MRKGKIAFDEWTIFQIVIGSAIAIALIVLL